MMTKEKALEIARSAGWLSEQSPALQDDLLARCILRTYSEKETICNVGDPHHGLYALVSGVLRVELSTMGEDYRIASVKQPVFWFGEAASLARSSFYVTITAATPASLLFLPHHDFERLIDNAAYCRALSVLLIGHIEEALQVIAQMLEGDVENRIAARVALLAERSGPQQPHVIPVTQSDLAEMVRPEPAYRAAGAEQSRTARPHPRWLPADRSHRSGGAGELQQGGLETPVFPRPVHHREIARLEHQAFWRTRLIPLPLVEFG